MSRLNDFGAALLYLLLVLPLVCFGDGPQSVLIQGSEDTFQYHYAADRLQAVCQALGSQVQVEIPASTPSPDQDVIIELSTAPQTVKAESFTIETYTQGGSQVVRIIGDDEVGLIYGGFDAAEQIRNNGDCNSVQAKREEPHVSFRAIKFNLPWDAYRSNPAITIHEDTCKDLVFWESFLDMMAENRFNTLTLWNLHPFNFMIRPTNFPEACTFDDTELAQWQTLFHGIFTMARERGIDTYIVNWNIFVSKGFEVYHNLPRRENLSIQMGDITVEQAELVKTYNRECVSQVLNEYPNLTGIGFSLGERMKNMTPQEREDWILETIVAGTQAANRQAKLIHRLPFSADNNNGEQVTRTAIENITDVQYPIHTEVKFNWSHGHSTPVLVKIHGGEISDYYWNPPPTNYKMDWMIRNEDFFFLRWGVPDFIREHVATNFHDYVGGYYIGSECYIPAFDLYTKDPNKNWEYAYQRQWLFYKLWGRLLYNPQTPDQVFRDEFVSRYGSAASVLLDAYSQASQMPLLFCSFIDATSDLTCYAEGFVTRHDGQTTFTDVESLIDGDTLDPNYLSIRDYVDDLLAQTEFPPTAVTPIQLADTLDNLAMTATTLVAGLDAGANVAYQYEITDILTWSALSRYFADKLRGGVAFYTFKQTHDANDKDQAINHLEDALAHWDEIVALTEPMYNRAFSTHMLRNDDKTFHWTRFRPDAANDIEIVRQTDFIPPTPNPARFGLSPRPISSTEIRMTAEIGSDPHGLVEYYFDETSGKSGGSDSGWQADPNYIDDGLSPATEYSYTVKMRDVSENSTEDSNTFSTYTFGDTDIIKDNLINGLDLSALVNHWLEQDCNIPSLCDGADLNINGIVDFLDYSILAKYWLKDMSPHAFQQDSGPQGILCMEAEHFTENVPQGDHNWVLITSPAGASGGEATEAVPDNGTTNNTNYGANSPHLDFLSTFVKTGVHYVWVRMYASGGNHDSCHAGIDNQENLTANRIEVPEVSQWTWTNTTMELTTAAITIDTTGLHKVNIWMREDGCLVDKILLTTDPNYVPAGAGPDESPFENTGLVFTPIADAHVRSDKPTDNFHDETNLRVQYGSRIMRSFLRFDVAGIDGETVVAVTLRLKEGDAGTASGAHFEVREVIDDWMETTVTWNYQPSYGAINYGSYTGGVLDEGQVFEVTIDPALVSGGDGIYDIVLAEISGGNNNDTNIFSRESAYPPELIVTIASNE